MSVGAVEANDGVFYASGNGLLPKEETTIELRKELLKLKRVGREMEVSVDFTFFNPGDPKTELVGFVTPPADGDVTDDEKAHPHISKFTVLVNGKPLKYKVARMEGSGFRVGEERGRGDDFIYHFPVSFKKGENRIQHSYTYRGGGSVDTAQEFYYRLTTGRAWANRQIDSFTLEIDLGEGAFFAVPAKFDETTGPVLWEAKGKSTIGPRRKGLFETEHQMFCQRDGILRLHMKEFRPFYDLELIQWQVHNEVRFWMDDPKDLPDFLQGDLPPGLLGGWASDEQLEELDKETLRFARNYFYARKGHEFKSADLQKIFRGFQWYTAKPGKAVVLSAEEKEYVARIKRVEAATRQ